MINYLILIVIRIQWATGTVNLLFIRELSLQEKSYLVLSLLGYVVIPSKDIEAGEFLLEYAGRHMTGSEGEALFKEYSAEDAVFLYFYSFQGHVYW